MKRKRLFSYKDLKDNDYQQSQQPSCTICLQKCTNQTFLRDCFHYFCLVCIRQWIAVVPECPLCKQTIRTLIYNVDEVNNTYHEYKLADKKTTKHQSLSPFASQPPPPAAAARGLSPWLERRRQLYRQLPAVLSYPSPLPRLRFLDVIQPDHIAKIRPFLHSELTALLGPALDDLIETHILHILLIPYHTNMRQKAKKPLSSSASPPIFTSTSTSVSPGSNEKKSYSTSFQQEQGKSINPTTAAVPELPASETMTIYDTTIIQQLAEWIDEDPQVVRRLLEELLAYLKSGMSYMNFINSAQYAQQDGGTPDSTLDNGIDSAHKSQQASSSSSSSTAS